METNGISNKPLAATITASANENIKSPKVGGPTAIKHEDGKQKIEAGARVISIGTAATQQSKTMSSTGNVSAHVSEPRTPGSAIPQYMALAGFGTEEFLSRVNLNEKISNILRSPATTPNGVRQRSVFTSINPIVSRFNAGATPFVSQQRSVVSAGGPAGVVGLGNMGGHGGVHSHSNGHSAGHGGPHSVAHGASLGIVHGGNHNGTHGGASSKDAHIGNGTVQTGRGIPIPPHLAVSPHRFTGGATAYEPQLTSRTGGISRGVFNTRFPTAPPPSPIYAYENDVCRPVRPANNTQSHQGQFPQPMPPPPYAVARLSASQRIQEYENPTPPPCPGAGPVALSNGTIQLRLRDGIRIDMTLDKAVRVLNQRSMVAIALSRNCSNSAMIHPNGRVLQCGSKVEIVTYDGTKSNNFVRYAKMWYKGVSFTSESCALIYLVDTAGTRTTTDTFTDLTKDYTLTVFYDDSRHGPSYVQDANEVIQSATYTCNEEGTEIFELNGFRITQAADGLVKLTRTHNKCLIRTSPGNGSATLTTPGIHCTASLGKTSHLFVRRNEKRMHFDGACFIVRNAGHSAGFNENNLLIVY